MRKAQVEKGRFDVTHALPGQASSPGSEEACVRLQLWIFRTGIDFRVFINVMHVPHQHHDHRSDRQRQQNAGEAEQLATRQNRKDHRHRVQTDAIPYQ